MKKILAVLPVLCHLYGCASIFSNSAVPVFIDSQPPKAAFVIKNFNGVEIARGETPATIILETGAGYFKGAAYTVQFTKPGYEPFSYGLYSRINEWYFTNINVVGLAIDPATGAMWKLPQELTAKLAPLPRLM